MTWGLGFGSPYGGGPLTAAEDQLAPIAGDPFTFDFTDEPNGPLPGMWETYALEHDGAGALAWSEEPTPDAFFRVTGGLGLWDYTRSPALPPPLTPYSERGHAAGPRGVLEGRNARVSLIVRQPVGLLDGTLDELTYSVAVAVRLDPATGSWVGARMRAVWQSGVWVEPLVLEIVQADGGDPVVLASAAPSPAPDLLDVWRTQLNAELIVELRGDTLTASLDGVIETSSPVPADGPAKMAVLIEATRRDVAGIFAQPVVVALQVSSLRDLERMGPPPAIPGSSHLEALPFSDTFTLPIRDLVEANLIKQISGRQFQFEQDTEVEVAPHRKYRFDQGEVIRLEEKLTTQTFIPCIRDLHYERSKKKGL